MSKREPSIECAEIELMLGRRRGRIKVAIPESHMALLLHRCPSTQWAMDRNMLVKDLGRQIGRDIERLANDLLKLDDP